MRKQRSARGLGIFLAAATALGGGFAAAAGPHTHRTSERIDRGIVAAPTADGVYVGWRLLADDPADIAFDVYRRLDGGAAEKLNREPIRQTTDFVDTTLPPGARADYAVQPAGGGAEQRSAEAAVERPAGNAPPPYRAIRLEEGTTFQKVGIADLTGDGRYDFVLKTPHANVDPYEHYWKPSPGTYQLEAYAADGKPLWRHDLGWSIEQGIWYSPYVVYDLNGDGRAEIAVKTGEGDPRDADGRVQSGPEYLTILDGQTGRPIARTAWPSRDGFGEGLRGYNHASRNQICVAYLDGKTPALVVVRGTYNLMKVVAYRLEGRALIEIWRWDNEGLPRTWWGQGAHWTLAADLTGDGRDEVVLGSAVLRPDGTPLWTTGLGHPDHAYVGDIDPQRPGLEIYYGIESRRDRHGMCLVDGKTGEVLWGLDQPTRHVHGQGLCSDLDARHAGSECYSAESNPAEGKSLDFALMHNARGEVIDRRVWGGFSPWAVHWDADHQREMFVGGRVFDYPDENLHLRVEGRPIAVADLLGDWREEIITSVPGEMRIYSTTIPARDRRACLMQDRLYRLQVVGAAMGYYQPPMLSWNIAYQAQQRDGENR